MIEGYGRFIFRYCRDSVRPGKFKILIEHQPGYQTRATECAKTHRFCSRKGGPLQIGIEADRLPETLDEARSLAHRWAHDTENYIRTGVFSDLTGNRESA